ncbi:phage tail protein [Marinoscillum sp. MHG1-6]|nr:phage tail protein [Marinoscillum sp. MHG1-6]
MNLDPAQACHHYQVFLGWYIPDLDSDASGMAVEKIELAAERIERAD